MVTSVIEKPISKIHFLHRDSKFGSIEGAFATNFMSFLAANNIGGSFLITTGTWQGESIYYQGWSDNGSGICCKVGARPYWFQIVNGTFTYGVVS